MQKKLKIVNAECKGFSGKAVEIYKTIGAYIESNWDELCSSKIHNDADVIIVRLSKKIDQQLLSIFHKLKFIISAATGTDHLDLKEIESRGINILTLKNEIKFLKTITSTPELTWGLLLSLIRNIPSSFDSVKNGSWQRDNYRGIQLSGKTLGVIGFGRTGKQVATYGRAFGMDVLYYDPNISNSLCKRCKSLNELLSNSDVITLHVHLKPDTFQMLNRTNLTYIKKGAFFINTSRADLVDEDYLVNLLQKGQLKGIATDVLHNELYDIHISPLFKSMLNGSNIIITPHIGGATADAMNMCEIFLAEKLCLQIDL